MADMNLTPLEPDEAMHAFLDGELDITDEQRLFDELASSPDLRTEMKDALSIRNAVHRDLMAPSPAVETGLMGSLGFASGVQGAASAVQGAMVQGASKVWLNRLFTGVFGLAAGFIIAWFVLDRNGNIEENNNAIAGEQSKQTAPVHNAPQTGGTAINHPDTVYATRVITKTVPVYVQDPTPRPTELQPAEPIQTVADNSANESNTEKQEIVSQSDVQPATSVSLASSATHRSGLMQTNSRLLSPASPYQYTQVATFRLRSLASGLPQNEPTPQSVQDSPLPNSAFALFFPISENHRLGAEFGTESFRQEFTGTEGDRDVSIVQTPVLMWMGATYQWNFLDFSALLPGLGAYGEATAAYAWKQGPLGRATVGLSYQPIGIVRFNVGLDGSALMYSHQGNNFFSTKWGVSYGISFDVGAIK